MALALKDRLARQAAGETQLTFDPTGRDEPRLVTLPLDRVDPDPGQPRRGIGDVSALADSIREHGLINPLIVEVGGQGRYRLIAGERRRAACLMAGLAAAPCIVRTVVEQDRLELQLIENLHRKDLHPLEEAHAYQRLMNEFNMEQKDLARRLGRSLSSVNETLRLLDLNSSIQEGIRTSENVSKSVLLEIAREPDSARQEALWAQAQAGQLTVRGARETKQPRGTADPGVPRPGRQRLVKRRSLSGSSRVRRTVNAHLRR